MMQPITCFPFFREVSLHDFAVRGHVFLIGRQIKIKFCMGSHHAVCTKFSGQSHDALNLVEKHRHPGDRLFFCLRNSSFEFKRLKKVRM